MKKPLAIILLLVAAVVCVVTLGTREPHYRGRPLSSWLEHYSDASLDEKARRGEAEKAIRAIGAEKVLPKLLALFAAKDSRFHDWITARAESVGIHYFHRPSAAHGELLALAGFEILGTNGAPAIAGLTKFLGDPDKAFMAVRCLEQIGKPAESVLCQCVTNRDPQVRRWSVIALAAVTDEVEVYIDRIKDCLNDENQMVRVATVGALGDQTHAPELAIPLLLKVLNDPDDMVSSTVIDALAPFGTNAEASFPILTNFINSGQKRQKRAGMNALSSIAPAKALPVLSNAVVNGSNETLGIALKNVKLIAPELALRMVLHECRSEEPSRRSQAISFLDCYDMETPGIVKALQAAAQDDEPEVSRRAINTMRQLREKKRESGTGEVTMTNEPSYKGKPLGVWLKMRSGPENEFSTNAVEALKQMGTNVIPALLARLDYKDPVFGLPDYEVCTDALIGLVALREHAKPALPKLGAMMDSDDPDLAVRAMVATIGTGADAFPYVMKGLTNRFSDVRNQAAGYLIDDLGRQFGAKRKQAVPILLQLLDDSDPSVRSSAATALKAIEPKEVK